MKKYLIFGIPVLLVLLISSLTAPALVRADKPLDEIDKRPTFVSKENFDVDSLDLDKFGVKSYKKIVRPI